MSHNVVRCGTLDFQSHHRATIWFPKPKGKVFEYRSIDTFSKKVKDDNKEGLLGFDCQLLKYTYTMLKYENVVL